MRKALEKYTKMDAMNLPDLCIKFCYNRAVITIKKPRNDRPRRHYEVNFGLFFWARILIGLAVVYYKEVFNPPQRS